MTALQVLNGQRTFLDRNGDPLASGQVFFYVPGTTQPSTTWIDQGLSVPNTNPVLLDQAGRAIVWGQGLYRQVVLDQFGNTQWDQLTGVGSDPAPGIFTTLDTSEGVRIGGTLSVAGSTTLRSTLNVLDLSTLNGLFVTARSGYNTAITSQGDVLIRGSLMPLTINSVQQDTTRDPLVPVAITTADGRIVKIAGEWQTPDETGTGGPGPVPVGVPGIVLDNMTPAGVLPDGVTVNPAGANWGMWSGNNTTDNSLLTWGLNDTTDNPILPVMALNADANLFLTSGNSPGIVINDTTDNLVNAAGTPVDWKIEDSASMLRFGLYDPKIKLLVNDLMHLDSSGNLTIMGTLTQAAGAPSASASTVNGNLTVTGSGVIYSAFGGHAVGFNWTGTVLNVMVDGSAVGSIAMNAPG